MKKKYVYVVEYELMEVGVVAREYYASELKADKRADEFNKRQSVVGSARTIKVELK